MELYSRLRKFENLHILFWLLKDSCWMLEFKAVGTAMIVPTVFLAAYLSYKTYGMRDFFINVAIFFWISANSFWMLMEFYNNNNLKNYSAIPFVLGILFVVIYYVKRTPGDVDQPVSGTNP
jgi:hypothetical protein